MKQKRKVSKSIKKIKLIDLRPEKRFDAVNSLANDISKLRSLKKIKSLVEEIHILCNTKLLKQLNQSIKDLKKGKFKVRTK